MIALFSELTRSHCGRDRMDLQPVPITTKDVSTNPAHGEVYSMQHYVIKFVNVLLQICGFLRVLRFSPGTPVSSGNKTNRHNIT